MLALLLKNMRMAPNMKGLFRMKSEMAMENSITKEAVFMMGNGKTIT